MNHGITPRTVQCHDIVALPCPAAGVKTLHSGAVLVGTGTGGRACEGPIAIARICTQGGRGVRRQLPARRLSVIMSRGGRSELAHFTLPNAMEVRPRSTPVLAGHQDTYQYQRHAWLNKWVIQCIHVACTPGRYSHKYM